MIKSLCLKNEFKNIFILRNLIFTIQIYYDIFFHSFYLVIDINKINHWKRKFFLIQKSEMSESPD